MNCVDLTTCCEAALRPRGTKWSDAVHKGGEVEGGVEAEQHQAAGGVACIHFGRMPSFSLLMRACTTECTWARHTSNGRRSSQVTTPSRHVRRYVEEASLHSV